MTSLISFAKRSILDIWHGSEYATVLYFQFLEVLDFISRDLLESGSLWISLNTIFKMITKLTLSCIMLWNGQTYIENLAVFTLQDFQSMCGHFTTLCMKGLKAMAEKYKLMSWIRVCYKQLDDRDNSFVHRVKGSQSTLDLLLYLDCF